MSDGETLIRHPALTEYSRPPVADLGGRPHRRYGDDGIIRVGHNPAPPAVDASESCPVPGIRDDLRRISTSLSVLLDDVTALAARCDDHIAL